MTSTKDILLIILAIFLPPLAVFLKVGCNNTFWSVRPPFCVASFRSSVR